MIPVNIRIIKKLMQQLERNTGLLMAFESGQIAPLTEDQHAKIKQAIKDTDGVMRDARADFGSEAYDDLPHEIAVKIEALFKDYYEQQKVARPTEAN